MDAPCPFCGGEQRPSHYGDGLYCHSFWYARKHEQHQKVADRAEPDRVCPICMHYLHDPTYETYEPSLWFAPRCGHQFMLPTDVLPNTR